MRLKISSPSLAASHALTTSEQSFEVIIFLMAVNCFRLLPFPVIGFSLTGSVIPAGSGTLVTLTVEGYNSGDFCMTDLVLSFIGVTLWLWVALLWRDRALIILNAVAMIVLGSGLLRQLTPLLLA